MVDAGEYATSLPRARSRADTVRPTTLRGRANLPTMGSHERNRGRTVQVADATGGQTDRRCVAERGPARGRR
jgi:hypothetical protein